MEIHTFLTQVMSSASSGIFENPFVVLDPKKTQPGVAFFDADGTILDSSFDQWKALMVELPAESQARIMGRLRIYDKSSVVFDQSYLTAGTLYEYRLAGWTVEDIQTKAQKIQLRDGVCDSFNLLQQAGYQVVIVSYGNKLALEALMKFHGLSNILVFANRFLDSNKKLLVPSIPGFIPPYQERVLPEELPPEYLHFVKSVNVTPATKGTWVKKVLEKYSLESSHHFAVGDSLGDLGMLQVVREAGGTGILHLHSDKGKLNNSESDLESLLPQVTHFSLNKTDRSFQPTQGLLEKLVGE